VKKIVLISIGVVVIAALVILNVRSEKGSRTKVLAVDVEHRDVTEIVTASGTITPARKVDVSASAMGKITEIAVVEGQWVTEGDFLLQIEPRPYETAVEELRAAVRGAQATLELEMATLKKAEYDYERAQDLNQKGFVSVDELRDAQVAVEIAAARVRTARETLAGYQASLDKATYDLDEVHITAEMGGVITALNVEEGESAIMGTLNNPGTVLLTIADLSEMEVEVLVDETEVVSIEVGQEAVVRLDAFPDTTFNGVIKEVGNSAVRSQLGLGQESVDFKVVVGIADSIPSIRPGLSASVDIIVAEAYDVLAIPIQCLTVREDKDGEDDEEIEGVFVVSGREAQFRPVRVGIAGEKHFQVESGLEEGETVVSGPFKAINELRDGDRVKVDKQDGDEKD